MKTAFCSFLMVLSSWVVFPGAVQAASKEEEIPWPYGKAEADAPGITDVLILIRKAGDYRHDCVRFISENKPFDLIERYGREAKNWYRAVLEREPSNAYATLCIGFMDLMLGRASSNKNEQSNYYLSAMSRFREALEKRPGYADAYLYMAQVQALRQDYAEAEKNLRLILDSGIENSQIHAWMAYVLAQSKRGQEAAVHANRAIELDNPSDAAQWGRDNKDRIKGAK